MVANIYIETFIFQVSCYMYGVACFYSNCNYMKIEEKDIDNSRIIGEKRSISLTPCYLKCKNKELCDAVGFEMNPRAFKLTDCLFLRKEDGKISQDSKRMQLFTLAMWIRKRMNSLPTTFMNMKNCKSGQNILPLQKTVHSGWMWKKGAYNQLTNRRWFEIKGDQLYYFKSKTDATPLGQIGLAGNEIKRLANVADNSGKYVFELVAGKERAGRPVVENYNSLMFGTATPYEMEEWIKAINRVIYSPSGGGMFGRPLSETIKVDSRRGGGMVPIIVEKCVEYLKLKGISEEGVFRIPGLKDDVEALKSAFNRGENVDLSDGSYKINIVASVLKQYIGDLPESVIPPQYYEDFIAIGTGYGKNEKVAVEKFTNLLKRVPRVNFNLLKYLCRYLYLLQSYEESTKMSLSNLSLVFGPNILRPQNEDPALLLKSLSDVNNTTMALITYQEQLFPYTEDETYYKPVETDEVMTPSGEIYDFRRNPPLPCPISKMCLPQLRKSRSEGNLYNLIDDDTQLYDGKHSNAALVSPLKQLFEEQRIQFQEQIHELESKLDAELKIRMMLKIRLDDEHKARVAAEDRLETYRAGIEEYCKKFGHADISIH